MQLSGRKNSLISDNCFKNTIFTVYLLMYISELFLSHFVLFLNEIYEI